MVRDPIVDSLIVLLRVLDIFMDLRGIVGLARAVPCAHMNTDSKAIGEDLLRSLDIDIQARRGRGRVEVWMVGGELTTES